MADVIHALVVEDDENLRLALVDNLEDEGHQVREAATVEEAVDAKTKLLVAIGSASYHLFREKPSPVPVLVTMMTRHGFEQMTEGGASNTSALHLDQPESRFMDLVSLLPGSPARKANS